MELFALLIIFPIAALLIAATFAAIAYVRKRKLVAVVAGLWLLYGIYESLMYARILCSGECNIRIDLLVIYPVLIVATVAGIVGALWRRR